MLSDHCKFPNDDNHVKTHAAIFAGDYLPDLNDEFPETARQTSHDGEMYLDRERQDMPHAAILAHRFLDGVSENIGEPPLQSLKHYPRALSDE